MSASLGETYLFDRGITRDTILVNGIEIDQNPDSKRIKERLGGEIRPGGVLLSHAIREIIWFPVRDSGGMNGEWIARPLPTIGGCKFLCRHGAKEPIYIPPSVWAIAKKSEIPIILTEGPVKALAVTQAGYAAIGLNGVWGATLKDKNTQKRSLREELAKDFVLTGRKVYLAFDADAQVNPEVRRACIATYLLLTYIGAEVYQLTSWDLSKDKGIDDFLVDPALQDEPQTPQAKLESLFAEPAPFSETLRNNAIDLAAVGSELKVCELHSLFKAQISKMLAPKLGVRTDDLRKVVPDSSPADNNDIVFEKVEPLDQPVDGDCLFRDICALIRKHIIVDEYALAAISLVIILTYLTEKVDYLPILGITSPTKRCGKTRLVTVISRLADRVVMASNFTAAPVFRAIDRWHPTLILDEADTFMGGEEGEALRGVLNSGCDRATAYVIRCQGEAFIPRRFSTFAVRVIARIGKLPATIADRSIHIELKRRTQAEAIEPLRNTPLEIFKEFRRQIMTWVGANADNVAAAQPSIPGHLGDREADVWFPLLAIAEAMGPDTKEVALNAMNALCSRGDDESETSIAILLGLRTLCNKRFGIAPGTIPSRSILDTIISTDDILEELNNDREAPWADTKEKMTAKKLSVILRRFKIKSKRDWKAKAEGYPSGYRYGDLLDAFLRYLCPPRSDDENSPQT